MRARFLVAGKLLIKCQYNLPYQLPLESPMLATTGLISIFLLLWGVIAHWLVVSTDVGPVGIPAGGLQYCLLQNKGLNARRSLSQPQHAHVKVDIPTTTEPGTQSSISVKHIFQLCVDASHMPPSLHLCKPPILQPPMWCKVGHRHPRHCSTTT